MASINQIVSELAHSVQQADSVPVRRAFKLSIIHSRNDIIRKDNTANKVADKVLQQSYRVTLIDVTDGDNTISKDIDDYVVKRSLNKIPRAVRLSTGLPFHSVRTMGVKNPISIPFVKQASSNYYAALPGMTNAPTYDLINEYIYLDNLRSNRLTAIDHIIVETIFEYPFLIKTETEDGVIDIDSINDDDEFLLPEDMVNTIKKMCMETFNPNVNRQTNEIPTPNLVK